MTEHQHLRTAQTLLTREKEQWVLKGQFIQNMIKSENRQ